MAPTPRPSATSSWTRSRMGRGQPMRRAAAWHSTPTRNRAVFMHGWRAACASRWTERLSVDAASNSDRPILSVGPEACAIHSGQPTGEGAEEPMRKFIIERELPKIGSAEREQLRDAAKKSSEVLERLAPDVQWVESHVADDKMFCVYMAKDEGVIRRHAEMSGFPATKITEVRRMIDPTTANG